MEPMRENAIFEWGMTHDEAETYKIAVAYEEEFIKTFGSETDGLTYRKNTLPKRGDPRKSNLFRYCWKLRRETRGLLEPHEYRQYIRANLEVLNINNKKGEKKGKVRVEPNAICGDKAWIRWKVFERWRENKLAEIDATPPPSSASTTHPKAVREIDTTKKFLFEKCEGEPTREKIQKFLDDGFFKFWVATGKVSKFYVALSPYVEGYRENIAETCSFDLTLVKERATKEVREYFNAEFRHEQ